MGEFFCESPPGKILRKLESPMTTPTILCWFSQGKIFTGQGEFVKTMEI